MVTAAHCKVQILASSLQRTSLIIKSPAIMKLPNKITKAIEKVVIHQCSMCGAFLGDKEFKQFEGVCKKHWDY
jgi:hypothetical protein